MLSLSILSFALLAGVLGRQYPLIELGTLGTAFDELPYADWLQKGNNDLDISIEVATLLARDANGSVLMRVNAPVYRNMETGDLAPFGPLLRVKRGGSYSVKLTNNLIDQPPGSNATQNHVGYTNFHVHGIHESTGAIDRATVTEYVGGDNIFITVKGKLDNKSSPNTITLFGSLPEDHLPGNHWYHAHHHLATTIQTFAAHGGIIVDDDPAWLPDSQGCGNVRKVMNEAVRKIMLFTCFPFFMDPKNMDDINNSWDAANYQLAAEQGNATYCCDTDNKDSANSFYGTGTQSDLVFLNGGFQPKLTMKRGAWQRWSMTLASYKNALLMQVTESKSGEPTKECDVMLLSKDGIFLMEIPRTVSYMFIPSGGRAEILIRCNGPAGSEYDIVSSATDTPAGSGINGNSNIPIQKVLSVIIADGRGDVDLEPKACTPLRPSYAADLRDAALKSLDVKPTIDPIPTFTGNPPGIGCSMSGEAFDFNQTPYNLPIGSVVEWQFERLAAHPLHTHINPFQVQEISPNSLLPNTTLDGGWFEAGDYYDTLLIPMMLGANATNPNLVPLRLQPGPYAGYTVTHCHFLMHEDAGCMHMMEYTCPKNASVSAEMPFTCSQEMPVPGTFIRGPIVPDTPPAPSSTGMAETYGMGLFFIIFACMAA